MRTLNSLRILAGVVVAVLLAASQASATIAYQNPAGNYGNQLGGPYVFGLQFTVGSSPLSVTQLGAFDNNQDGWNSPVSVAIYDFNLHSIVGSTATFSGTSGSNLGTLGSDGGSRFLPVTPFTLTAGGSYMVVAANYGGIGGELAYNDHLSGATTTLAQAPDISVGNNYYDSGSAMTFPTTHYGTPNPAYAAGTFEFTPVPEATAFGAAAVGLLGLVYIGRYARLRRKMTPA
jgi:hypothetical protein